MLAAMVMRVIWMFTGNEWASWREWVPSTWARFKEIFGIVRFYSFFSPRYPEPAGGHNALAGLAYVGIYSILAFMFLSGIALEGSPGPGEEWRAWVAAPVAWIPGPMLKFLHHVGMWLIWVFMAFHIGVATLIDAETRGNCYSAIFSGWRSRLRKHEHAPEGGPKASAP
jgi:Ni/Fe-hydrogenase 1 B-type cytochrome subunit